MSKDVVEDVDHAERAHSKLSASGSFQWLACPASIRMTEGIEETGDNIPAREGTAAHELGDWCLTNGKATKQFKQKEIDGFATAGEMKKMVQEYVDFCNNLEGEHFTEQRVSFEEWVEDGFGTSDFISIEGKTCTVVDLKYGKGVRVFAEENSQAMLYGLGVLNQYGLIYDEIEEFNLVIHQPRLDHIDEWTISKDDLLEWGEYVRVRAELTSDPDAPFGPSEKSCQWCLASDTCKARAEWALETAISEFEGIHDFMQLKDTETLDETEFAILLPRVKGFIKWANSLSGTALTLLERGKEIEGYKLVESRTNREWADPEIAEKALRRTKLKVSEIWKKTLISPAQAEEVIGKKHSVMEEQVTKPKGRPVIAPIMDKREAIVLEDEFADIDSEEDLSDIF